MGANAYNPKGGVSIHKIEQTSEDRAEFKKQWKEDREHKERLKDERYAAIQERRKKNKPGGGSGGGINIEVS